MEGQDANERGAYKKKDGFQRRGIETQVSKKKKKKNKKNIERREWTVQPFA